MNNTLRLSLLIFLFSCNSKIDNSVLIESNFYTGQGMNMMSLEEVKGLSRQYYQGKPDTLIKELEEVFAKRRASGFRLGGEISDINFTLLLPYFDSALSQFSSLQETHLFWPESEKNDFETIVQNAKNIVNTRSQDTELLELVIAINTIDRILLSAIRSSFSDGHELLKFEFFFYENRAPQIGLTYKVFLTPQLALPKTWDVVIDSVQFQRNGQTVSERYTLEILGSVGYFQFVPEKKGEYELKGIYSAGIKEEFLLDSGEFKYSFEIE